MHADVLLMGHCAAGMPYVMLLWGFLDFVYSDFVNDAGKSPTTVVHERDSLISILNQSINLLGMVKKPLCISPILKVDYFILVSFS